MNRRSVSQKGYVALMTVLITSAVVVASSLSMLLAGTDSQREGAVAQHSVVARQLAAACGEEALQVLRTNSSYTGTASVTLSTGTCSYTVANLGGTSRQIDAVSTVNNVAKKIRMYVTINTSSISVTSWQEVA